MQQVVDRVRAKGLSIIGVTIIPRGRPENMMGWNSDMEKHRLAVNTWIRTQAKFDAVVDLDPLMKGGPVYAGSESLKPEFNCGDYIQASPAGTRRMVLRLWFKISMLRALAVPERTRSARPSARFGRPADPIPRLVTRGRPLGIVLQITTTGVPILVRS